jgi:hypothetical protein
MIAFVDDKAGLTVTAAPADGFQQLVIKPAWNWLMLAGNDVSTLAASTVTIVVEDDAVSVVHTPPPLVNKTFVIFFEIISNKKSS